MKKRVEGVGMKKTKKATGRPPELAELDYEWVERLAASGMTKAQIAAALNVSKPTLLSHLSKDPKFLAAVKRGGNFSDDRVEQALYSRAVGFATPDEHISNFQGEITRTPIIKRYPPDVAAAFIWLKNRRPDRWRHTPEGDTNDNRTFNFNFVGAKPPEKPGRG